MDATTERVVDYVIASDYARLSPQAVQACKQRLIDTFASAIGAWHEPMSVQARRIAALTSANPGASVLGVAQATSPENAAFANGVMIRVLDLSDTYMSRSRGHPSDMIAGVLAVAEITGASGREVINAVVLAYDIYCSFCDSVDIHSKGWDQPIYAALGTVCAAGKLLGLNRAQLGEAISMTVTPNMALYQTRAGSELSGWKGCAGPNAVRNGVFAALLAREGFTGPGAIFEGKWGLWDIVGKFDWKLPQAGEGSRIERTHVKCFPVCYHGQSAVWAALELRAQVKVADIQSIHVEGYSHAFNVMGNDPTRWKPRTHDTADHSLPYVVSTALLDGGISSASFTHDQLERADTAALMAKVTVAEDKAFTASYPETAAARVTIRTAAGEKTAEVRYPKGHCNAPMDDADFDRKFRDLYSLYSATADSAPVLQMLRNFERQTAVGDVFRLISGHVRQQQQQQQQ
jgi:2-methylcitrate dehydratase